MPGWLVIPGWLDLVDIALVAAFGWVAIGYFRRARARAALAGLALLGAVYFVALSLDLRLTEALFRSFFAVVVIVLVVVFQEDLRRVFERLGSWRKGAAAPASGIQTADLLVRTVSRLAANRVGALIVLPRREPLERHLEGGVQLGGRISEPLLLSLFDASSPGHDGAVLLRGSRVERFAVHLPLSANHQALGPGGTRHAAALGLAERCDAISIVVSEERGTVSVARDGALRTLRRPEDLASELAEAFPDEGSDTRRWWQGRAAWDGALAGVAALALWMVVVPGSDVTEATVSAPVEITNLPRDLELESVEPESVDVTLRGLRRDLLLAQPGAVAIQVDAYLARLGRRTFSVSEQNVRAPDALEILELAPDRIRLSLRTEEQEAAEDESESGS